MCLHLQLVLLSPFNTKKLPPNLGMIFVQAFPSVLSF